MTEEDTAAIKQQLADLTRQVRALQAALHPIDASGLPVPTCHVERDQTNIAGLRWKVGGVATVIAMDEPDSTECVYLRNYYGESTGDVDCYTTVDAIQLAGALLAAARASTDQLTKRKASQ